MRLETKKYTWIPFYEELALKLLSYKANRRALIKHLQSAYDGISMSLPKLDSTVIPADIDPFTVYGLFNKGITEANRKKVIGALSEEFGIEVEQPSDFAGIPLLNNLNATFYAFVGDGRRGEHDIDNLWRVFETAIMLADNDNERTRAEFVEAFNATVVQFGVGWKLGMGLYWVRPRRFINLDSRNRWFMGDMAFAGPELTQASPEEKDAPIHEGEAYLAICDVALAQLGSETCPYATFPELSNAAFEESNRVNEKKRAAAKAAEQEAQDNALCDANVETVHFWLYASGQGAGMWDDFYRRGIMGLGWSELGDLAAYSTKEDMRKRLIELHGEESSQKNSAYANWQFTHDVKPGDIVFAKRGMSEIIGRGIVEGDYEYDPDALDGYPHLRRVKWTHRGNWMRDKKFAQKILTDITDYTDLVAEVSALFDDAIDGGSRR